MNTTGKPLVFTPAELAFLATSTEGPRGQRTARELLLGEEPSDATLASGFGGLKIRGWLEDSGGGFVPVEPLAAIAWCLSNAARWFRLGFVQDDEASAVLAVWADGLGVTAQPIETGVVAVGAFSSLSQGIELVGELVGRGLTDAPGSLISVSDDTEGSTRSVVVRPAAASGVWEIAESDASGPTAVDSAEAVVSYITSWLSRG